MAISRLCALALFSFLAASAGAQNPVLDPLRFAPLEIGNRWEFVHQNEIPTPAVPLYYYLDEVVGEILIEGEPYRVLTEQKLSLDGEAIGPLYHCAFSLTAGEATAQQAGLSNYACPLLASPPPLPYWGPTTLRLDEPFVVGGQSYVADSLVSFGNYTNGQGGAFSAWAQYFATGVGHIASRSWGRPHSASCQGNPAGCDYAVATRLAFARVGGAVYGSSVVASEALPPGTVILQLEAWPNPSAGAQTLRVQGASFPATVTVFDALGRQVWRGVTTGETVALPEGVPGVYTVQVSDERGLRASIRSARL